MSMEQKQNKIWGIIGTVAFHVLLILLLVFGGFTAIVPQEEEGILVIVGDPNASTDQGKMSVQDPVPVMPVPATPPVEEPKAAPEVEEEMVTQDLEETVALADAKKKADEREKRRLEEKKRERERLLAEEKRRKEEEERKRKEAAIMNRVANVFQSAAQSANTGSSTEGDGAKGSPTGNASTGALSGSAGYGSYDLGGRGIRGGLPKPSFSSNESGIVVVNITVNADGKVTHAIVGQGTTTTSATLRRNALEAAKKALFETKNNVHSQTGTITYRFDSDN